VQNSNSFLFLSFVCRQKLNLLSVILLNQYNISSHSIFSLLKVHRLVGNALRACAFLIAQARCYGFGGFYCFNL